MTDKEKIVDLSRSYAEKGFLCSESVLLAISELLGIRSELIPKIASGFGAGIGGRGSLCGAAAGGIMALGLRFGRSAPKQEMVIYPLASEFVKRFGTENGHTMCRELTGCDFATEAGRRRYKDEKMWETRCRQYIAGATAIVFDLVSK